MRSRRATKIASSEIRRTSPSHRQLFLPQEHQRGGQSSRLAPSSRETELKLLPMLLQVALDGRKLAWGGQAKSPVFIDID